MSIEEHPLANVVGLMMDICESIKKYRRGEALEFPDEAILQIASEVSERIHDKLREELWYRGMKP